MYNKYHKETKTGKEKKRVGRCVKIEKWENVNIQASNN